MLDFCFMYKLCRAYDDVCGLCCVVEGPTPRVCSGSPVDSIFVVPLAIAMRVQFYCGAFLTTDDDFARSAEARIFRVIFLVNARRLES